MNRVTRAGCLRHLSLGACAFLFCVAASAAPLEEISAQEYPLSADGSLSVVNTDGTTYIYAWSENSVRVVTRKRAYSKERLQGIAVKVSNTADAINIETSYPPKPEGLSTADRSGTVDFLILVPQKATIAKAELSAGEIIISGMYGRAVNARLTNGRITLENCYADTHVSVTDGALDIFYAWDESLRFAVDAQIARGHLRVGLPLPTAVQIDAESGDGKIFNQFAETDASAEQEHRLQTVIGDGSGARFKLRATHGNIGILKYE